MKKFEVTVYTDGSCKGNPGPGGYGVILECNGQRREVAGFEPISTNNRMELTAVIAAVKHLNKPCNITIVTDSMYVCNGIACAKERAMNGWRLKSGARAKNYDLWQELTKVGVEGHHKFRFQHVEAHSGHPENERCDQLAKEQIELNLSKIQ